MANGNVVKLGSLYVGGVLKERPNKPWRTDATPTDATTPGDITNYNNAGNELIEIKDTHVTEKNKLQWVKVYSGGKNLLISDRVILVNVSRRKLELQGLIHGREIEIDGGKYLIRLIEGGKGAKARGRGASPANEYDNFLCNQLGLDGLITPAPSDLDDTLTSADIISEHNKMWNWYAVGTIARDLSSNEYTGVTRGFSSPDSFSGGGSNDSASKISGWRPVLEVLNAPPTISSETTNNKMLYENDVFVINGTTTDTGNGDVVTVKYQINSGTVRNLHSGISNGTTPIPFSKGLTYSEGVLKDGSTNITSVLSAESPHVISVWAEDGNGGKSAVESRTFYVVPNRPPTITVNPIAAQSNLINSNVINLSGSVGDLDNNDVVVTFQINDGEPQEVHNGKPGIWAFNIMLKDLRTGSNPVVIKATDTYDAAVSYVLTIKKTHNAVPVNNAIALYKINPPTGSAQKILMWIERMLGDLAITA